MAWQLPMKAVTPDAGVLAAIREIAREGFSYRRTKELGQTAGWKLDDDELDLGYVAFEVQIAKDDSRRLSVQVSESGRPPRAFLPLYYIDDEECEANRKPFDQALRSLSEQLESVLGLPSVSGEYGYSHRENWLYSYVGWSLADATFVLAQDEFDIQFGMDVTLWVLPAGTEVAGPMSLE